MTQPSSANALPRPGFWRAYWVTLRPYLFFVSGAAGLAGLAVPERTAHATLVAAFAVFFCSYGLGQALTDVFQVDTDSLSSPYRPLVRGEVSRPQVFLVSLGGLTLCAATFWFINAETALLSVAGVLGLATYTPLKRRWWGGPAWNSWIVALLPLLGFLCGAQTLRSMPADPFLPWLVGSVFCSYAVFVLLGYLKDVSADRATGYETLPVRFGRRATVAVSAVFAAAALAFTSLLSLRVFEQRPPTPLATLLGAGLVCLALVWLVLAHLRMACTDRDDQAHPAIACSVRAFVALHAGEAAWLRPELALLGVFLVVGLELALAARPCESQI